MCLEFTVVYITLGMSQKKRGAKGDSCTLSGMIVCWKFLQTLPMALAAVIVVFKAWWCTSLELQLVGCRRSSLLWRTARLRQSLWVTAKLYVQVAQLKLTSAQCSRSRWARIPWSVIYGDNMAAISMAHGTGNATWRTRHLRVRSSFLKEALDGVASDGAWKLLHLRGTELVADGLTKPLAGQAFFKFVDDLGFAGSRADGSKKEPTDHAAGGGGNNAAIRPMGLGSMLLSTAESAPEVNDAGEDFSLIWTTGLLLVAMGAVYAGQLFQSATKCCLKRLRGSKESGHRPSLRRMSVESSEDEGTLMVSEAQESKMEVKKRGSCGASKANKIGGSTAAGSMSRSRDQGLGAAGSSSNPLTSLTSEQGPAASMTPGQGPATSQSRSTSMSLTRRSGTAKATASSALGEASSALGGASAALADASSALSGASAALSGDSSAAAAAAERPDSEIHNPWNLFQRRHRRKSWSNAMMAAKYHESRSKGTKPWACHFRRSSWFAYKAKGESQRDSKSSICSYQCDHWSSSCVYQYFLRLLCQENRGDWPQKVVNYVYYHWSQLKCDYVIENHCAGRSQTRRS